MDLRRAHNYIDPDIGITPSLNGQEITLDLVAGNPFSRNIFETRDKKWVVLSAVHVDLAYQWTAFLDCSMTESGVREATKKWDAAGCFRLPTGSSYYFVVSAHSCFIINKSYRSRGFRSESSPAHGCMPNRRGLESTPTRLAYVPAPHSQRREGYNHF